MSNFQPQVRQEDEALFVILAQGSPERWVDFDGILDQTTFGDIIGLEVLDLREQVGIVDIAPSPSVGIPRWSYDSEIDALYLRIADGHGYVQRHLIGRAGIDSSLTLVKVEIPTRNEFS